MFPKQNVSTVRHMFVSKGSWADRVEHGAMALVVGQLVIDADRCPIPVSLESLLLGGVPQDDHVQQPYLFSQ
jgi:hypothetical protein